MAPGIQIHLVAGQAGCQFSLQRPAIFLIPEQLPALVATCGHLINGPQIGNAKGSDQLRMRLIHPFTDSILGPPLFLPPSTVRLLRFGRSLGKDRYSFKLLLEFPELLLQVFKILPKTLDFGLQQGNPVCCR